MSEENQTPEEKKEEAICLELQTAIDKVYEDLNTKNGGKLGMMSFVHYNRHADKGVSDPTSDYYRSLLMTSPVIMARVIMDLIEEFPEVRECCQKLWLMSALEEAKKRREGGETSEPNIPDLNDLDPAGTA